MNKMFVIEKLETNAQNKVLEITMRMMQDHLSILLNEIDARDYIITEGTSKQKIIRCNQLRQLTGWSDQDVPSYFSNEIELRNELENQRQKLMNIEHVVGWQKQANLDKVRLLHKNVLVSPTLSRQTQPQL